MTGPETPFGDDPEEPGRAGRPGGRRDDDGQRDGHPGDRPGAGGAAPPGGPPRIPPPRSAAEDGDWPPPAPHRAAPALPGPVNSSPVPRGYSHGVLKSLLGAWALAACSAEESAAVEAHLTDCAGCADEALRLRDAVGLLHPEDGLDLDPMLRSEVLEGCLSRRPARIPVPEWAASYDAETARLDALLHDLSEDEWRAPVRLRWFDGREHAERTVTVSDVLGHLSAVDGTAAAALGLPDPLPGDALPAGAGPAVRSDPTVRTEASWRAGQTPRQVRDGWREQRHALIRTVSFGGDRTPGLAVPYGDFTLPVRDAFLDRAFECWVHAGDIADAIDYPYGLPAAPHLWRMLDLAARLLPGSLAARRRAGLASPARTLTAAGAPGRTLHLEVEGPGGGDWYIPLDSPGAAGSPEHAVAHVALDGLEFCQLAAGHVPPEEAAAGQDGDREAVRDVLFAAASLSRL